MKRVLSVAGDTGDPAPYLEAMRQVGVEVVFDSSLNDLSGLLLLGGTDVNPARYGELRGPATEDPDDARDLLELRLVADALDRDLPILAICRGMQLLNVQRGGTLMQDIPGHVRTTEDKSLNAHSIEIVPGTLLAGIAGGKTGEVNSRHHQAIGVVGDGLAISARFDLDGVIEAIELSHKKFVLGVQWHPENQAAQAGSIGKRLFEDFARSLGARG